MLTTATLLLPTATERDYRRDPLATIALAYEHGAVVVLGERGERVRFVAQAYEVADE